MSPVGALVLMMQGRTNLNTPVVQTRMPPVTVAEVLTGESGNGYGERYWPNTDEGIGDGTNGALNEFDSQGEFEMAYYGAQKVANCRQCCSSENEACGYDQNGGQYNQGRGDAADF